MIYVPLFMNNRIVFLPSLSKDVNAEHLYIIGSVSVATGTVYLRHCSIATPELPSVWRFCACSPMSLWVSSRFSNYFPPPQNIPVGRIASLKLPQNMNVYVCFPTLMSHSGGVLGWLIVRIPLTRLLNIKE